MVMPSEKTVQEACGMTLRQWPDGLAAVLFGSRARGTHRPDSDWDVALVSSSERRLPDGTPLRELDGVDVWVLPESDLRRRANALGSLAFEVARDGRLIAGRWERPQTEEGKVTIDIKFWESAMSQALSHARAAAASLDSVAWLTGLKAAAVECGAFVAHSAALAEFLGKAALVRRLVEAESTHDLSRLAQRLERKRPDQADTAARLRELDGDTSRHHLGPYPEVEVTAGDCARAGDRLTASLALWVDEIEEALDDAALAEAAQELIQTAVETSPRIAEFLAQASRPEGRGKGADRESREVVDTAMATVPALLSAVGRFTERVKILRKLDTGGFRP